MLVNLTKECVFSVNPSLIKQTDRSTMGGPESVGFFSNIFRCKMEDDVVVPAKPIFYKSYVNGTYIHRKKKVFMMNYSGI